VGFVEVLRQHRGPPPGGLALEQSDEGLTLHVARNFHPGEAEERRLHKRRAGGSCPPSVVGFAGCCVDYTIRFVNGCGFSTIWTGRPAGVSFFLVWSIPINSHTVARKSAVPTFCSTTLAPSLSVLPTTRPPLMPPPNMARLQARG